MKNLSKLFLSYFAILAFIFCLNFIALAQGSAGDTDAEKGTKIIRIGVLLPKVQLTEATGDVEPEEALRNSYAALMNSDQFEVVALESKLTSLALEEAKKKSIDFILNLDLTQEEKKSGGGLFGSVVRSAGVTATNEAANKVPYGGGTGERVARTAAQTAIINTGYTMSNMSVTVKKNDKFMLDYNLTSASNGNVIHTNKLVAKAKKNNDPVLMNLIEESANDLVTVLKKNLPQ